jgi:DNA repair protein RAD5
MKKLIFFFSAVSTNNLKVTSKINKIMENVSFPLYYFVFLEICPSKQSPLWLIHWRRIVLDEAHIIKCHTTKISEAVCTLSARFRWCLTGTPIQNSVEDVFPLLRFLKVDPWGTWSWWYKTIVQKIQTHRVHEAIIAVRRILHSIILRRTKETRTSCGDLILTLPKKKEYIVRLSLVLFVTMKKMKTLICC